MTYNVALRPTISYSGNTSEVLRYRNPSPAPSMNGIVETMQDRNVAICVKRASVGRSDVSVGQSRVERIWRGFRSPEKARGRYTWSVSSGIMRGSDSVCHCSYHGEELKFSREDACEDGLDVCGMLGEDITLKGYIRGPMHASS